MPADDTSEPRDLPDPLEQDTHETDHHHTEYDNTEYDNTEYDNTEYDNTEYDETNFDDAEAALREARARLGEIPAEVVVTNHVMGLYELAAIHLSAQPPRLVESALAIDAMGCLVEGLGSRLGPDNVTMAEALSNIRLAFVQIKGTVHPD